MKALFVILLFTLGIVASSCGGPCRTRSDCDTGESCDSFSGECVTACESNEDCGARAVCDLDRGQCELRTITIPRDAGSETSTVTDAG